MKSFYLEGNIFTDCFIVAFIIILNDGLGGGYCGFGFLPFCLQVTYIIFVHLFCFFRLSCLGFYGVEVLCGLALCLDLF